MTDDENPFVGKVTQKAVLFGPDDEVLVTKVDDHWEIPGGTFEYGETLVGGLRRELREELGIESRVGPPVEAVYGGWIDGDTYDPMVSLLYRCETDEREITLNDEHDDYEWVTPETAAERLTDSLGKRLGRAIERASALDDSEPFEAVVDPYDDTDMTEAEVLTALAEARKSDPPTKTS